MLANCELLTEDWWVPIEEVVKKPTKIAQYNLDRSIEFVYPINWITQIVPEVHEWSNQNIEFVCDRNHNLVSFNKLGHQYIYPSYRFKTYEYMRVSGKLVGKPTEFTGHDRLLILYHLFGLPEKPVDHLRGPELRQIHIEYKPKYLAKLANSLGYQYAQTGKHTTIIFPDHLPYGKLSNWVTLDRNYDWYEKVIETVNEYIGLTKIEVDEPAILTTLAHLCGYRGKNNRLCIVKEDNMSLSCLQQQVVKREMQMYGVYVPSGMLMCRTNRIFVSGV